MIIYSKKKSKRIKVSYLSKQIKLKKKNEKDKEDVRRI